MPGVTLCFQVLGFQVLAAFKFLAGVSRCGFWTQKRKAAIRLAPESKRRKGSAVCSRAQRGGVSPCAFGRKGLALCFVLGRKVPPFALGRNALFGVSRRGWRGAALLLVLRQAGSARGGRHAGVGAVIGCLSPCEKARFHIFKSGARCMTLGCGARLRGRRRSGARRRGGRGGGST